MIRLKNEWINDIKAASRAVNTLPMGTTIEMPYSNGLTLVVHNIGYEVLLQIVTAESREVIFECGLNEVEIAGITRTLKPIVLGESS